MSQFAIDPVGLSRSTSLVLAHFLWEGAVIAIIAWLMLVCARRARPGTRYALALSGFLTLAAAPLVTVAWIAIAAESPMLSTDSSDVSAAEADVPGKAPIAAELPSSVWHRLQPWCAAVWGVGVFVMAARLALGWWTVFRLKRKSAPAPSELLRLTSPLSAALALRRIPRVCVSQRISQAMVAGIWRPVVLVPSAWLLELPPGVLEAVLAHELAHIRRWDPWVNTLQRVVETLLFYHPAVWWLSRRVRIEREFCCDEAAVRVTGQPVVYAQTLELVARRHVGNRVPLFASGIGDPHMTLLQRVKHVLGRSGDDRPSGWLSPVVATLLIVAGIAVYRLAIATPGPLYAQEGEREAAERERESAEREQDERARRDGRERDEERTRREAVERGEEGVEENRDREPGERGPGGEAREVIRDLERQVAELRQALEATQRQAEEARRNAELRALEQMQRAQRDAQDAERRAREAAGEERREGGPDRPRPPMLDRPDVPRERPGAPREGEEGERRVREFRYEIRRGEGPLPEVRMQLDGPPSAEIREELNDIRNQVRELVEAVRNLQRTVESRGPGADGPRGPGGPFGEGFPGFRGFRMERERESEGGRRPEGERGPDAERRGDDARSPEGDRRPGLPGRLPRERRPDGVERPDGERPAADRVPGRDRPRPEGREPGEDRRPDGPDRPRGERAAEGDRGPERERGDDADRRPDDGPQPSAERRDEGRSAQTNRTSENARAQTVATIKVFRLQNVTASEAAKILNTLVPDVRVNEDQLTNSIVVVGTDDAVRTIQDVLSKLDVPAAGDHEREKVRSDNSDRPNEGDVDRGQPQKQDSEVEGDRVGDDAARAAFEIDVLQQKLKALEALEQELESASRAPVKP
jgi:beta-lactamase regulating signal transducer with metallopeptidase domain